MSTLCSAILSGTENKIVNYPDDSFWPDVDEPGKIREPLADSGRVAPAASGVGVSGVKP